jgi:hypothetical protein
MTSRKPERPERGSLAQAMYPNLDERARAKDELRAREQKKLVKELQELNAKLRRPR